MKITRKYKDGGYLEEGDIVAECQIGEIIWDGAAVIKERPLGVVVVYQNSNIIGMSPPEETDFYNIKPLRTGKIQLLDAAPEWMKKSFTTDYNGYSDLYLSTYDGQFYAWDNIEKIGTIYALPD